MLRKDNNDYCFAGKVGDLILNSERNVTTVAWVSNNRFEEVSDVNGNEDVVVNITGNPLTVMEFSR